MPQSTCGNAFHNYSCQRSRSTIRVPLLRSQQPSSGASFFQRALIEDSDTLPGDNQGIRCRPHGQGVILEKRPGRRLHSGFRRVYVIWDYCPANSSSLRQGQGRDPCLWRDLDEYTNGFDSPFPSLAKRRRGLFAPRWVRDSVGPLPRRLKDFVCSITRRFDPFSRFTLHRATSSPAPPARRPHVIHSTFYS